MAEKKTCGIKLLQGIQALACEEGLVADGADGGYFIVSLAIVSLISLNYLLWLVVLSLPDLFALLEAFSSSFFQIRRQKLFTCRICDKVTNFVTQWDNFASTFYLSSQRGNFADWGVASASEAPTAEGDAAKLVNWIYGSTAPTVQNRKGGARYALVWTAV